MKPPFILNVRALLLPRISSTLGVDYSTDMEHFEIKPKGIPAGCIPDFWIT
jgi:hypothetical protein